MSVVCYQSSQFWPAVINGGKSNHPFPSFYFVVVFAVVVVVVVERGIGVSCGFFFVLLFFREEREIERERDLIRDRQIIRNVKKKSNE